MQMYSEYKEDVTEAQDQITQVKKNFKSSLEQALYDYNIPQAEQIVSNLNHNSNFSYISLALHDNMDGDDLIYSFGKLDDVDKSELVAVTLTANESPVGTLSLAINYQEIKDKYFAKAIHIFARQCVKTMIVSALLLYVFSRVVVSHVVKISNHMEKLKPDKLTLLDLKRNNRIKDEFYQLEKNINFFSKDLSHSHAQLTDLNASLESKVKSKTSELFAKNKKLEKTLEELEIATEQLFLQEKLATVGQMTAGIAHEIKNPLYIISNSSMTLNAFLDELFEDDLEDQKNYNNHLELYSELGPEIKKLGAIVDNNCDRINGIVTNMLALTRGEDQTLTKHDMTQLFSEAVDSCCSEFQKEKDFEFSIRKELRSVNDSYCFRDDFSRVIINIVDNALYTLKEKSESQENQGYKPELHVEVREEEELLVFEIKDNGMGIPQNSLKDIFNPFYTTKPSGQGTGLGLSLARDIVKRHSGGHLSVQSEEGEWTKFSIKFCRIEALQ